MRNRQFLIVIACVFGVCPAVVTAAELRAGAARTDITPPPGVALWGYGARHDALSEGTHDPLQARALVLEVGDTRVALVSLDLGRAPTRDSMKRIRATAAAVGVGTVFLVGSHTHHGPILEVERWPTPERPYVRTLEDKLGKLITEAAGKLRPARLGVTTRQVRYNRNRHSRREDKPVDPDLTVLRVEAADGKVIAHAVNFAAHPTMRPSEMLRYSADYPGVMAATVEKGTGAPCLFLQGAAGDLSANPDPGTRGPDAFGEFLGKLVLKLAADIRCEATEKPTLQVQEEDFQFKSRIDLGNPGVKAAFVLAFFQDLVDFYEREYREGVRPHLTVALLDGRIGFVGVSGEFFCGHALSLKRRARLDHVLFLGYCNDYQQYFPTIEAASEGGYGADPTVSAAEVGAGERMIDRALVILYKMRGKLPNLPPGERRE